MSIICGGECGNFKCSLLIDIALVFSKTSFEGGGSFSILFCIALQYLR
jgi:hypothetical protein